MFVVWLRARLVKALDVVSLVHRVCVDTVNNTIIWRWVCSTELPVACCAVIPLGSMSALVLMVSRPVALVMLIFIALAMAHVLVAVARTTECVLMCVFLAC